jgi:hypothetical protein
MKKLATLVFALLLAGSLSFAQTGGGDKKAAETPKSDTDKKATKGKAHHKGGKKSKKGSAGATAGSSTPK